MRPKEISFTFTIPGQPQPVSALLEIPTAACALLVLAHGAGAGMRHPFLQSLSQALHTRKIGTLRFQFPYMERGSKRTDPPAVAMAAVAAAVAEATRLAPSLALFAGGKSFGARMTTSAAAAGHLASIRGIVCFGFPLHPPKRPDTKRADHLSALRIPTLFIQGTRDDLAELTLMRKVAKTQPDRFTMHVVEGADHSFAVLKSSGRTSAEVLAEIADAAESFCARAKLVDQRGRSKPKGSTTD